MKSRDRVIAAIEFQGPDRLPHKHSVLPASYAAHPRLPELLQQYPSDFAGEEVVTPPANTPLYVRGTHVDEWQCVWTTAIEGLLGQVTGHPLGDLTHLDDYRVPTSEAMRPELDGYRALAARRRDRYVLLGWITLFE